MEKDDEIKGKGNSYDFGARILDPRVGRWLSIDPLRNKYPNLSPYNFVANNPNLFVDYNGKDFIIFIEKTTHSERIYKGIDTRGVFRSVSKNISYIVIPAPGPDRIFYAKTADYVTYEAPKLFSPKNKRTVPGSWVELHPFDDLGINDRHCTSCLEGKGAITSSMFIPDSDFLTFSKLVPDELKDDLAKKDFRYNMLGAYQTEWKITEYGLAAFDLIMLADGISPTLIKLLKGESGVNLVLKMKPGWTAEQKAEAIKKVKALSENSTIVTKVPKREANLRGRFIKAGGEIEKGQDVDHIIDLQLGGVDEILNTQALDQSVNRSLGTQINNQIKDLPVGTVISKITIIE